jgi:hypothetical protein
LKMGFRVSWRTSGLYRSIATEIWIAFE